MENENETDEEIKEDKINWINLKPLLYAKSSYESAINYLKPKIFNEFNSYITDIYIHKIRTYYLTNKNKTIVSSGEWPLSLFGFKSQGISVLFYEIQYLFLIHFKKYRFHCFTVYI